MMKMNTVKMMNRRKAYVRYYRLVHIDYISGLGYHAMVVPASDDYIFHYRGDVEETLVFN